MKRFVILICALLSFTAICNAQAVKLKNNTIYLDGKETWSFDRNESKTEYFIYELGTKKEIINIISLEGGFKRVLFVDSRKHMKTKNAFWGKTLIQWMLEQKVLNVNGALDDNKVDLFIAKYDEQVAIVR